MLNASKATQPLQAHSLQSSSVTPNHSIPFSNSLPASLPPELEEEPYTIKCICGFAEDDGSTVLCEKCDTWQHIQCYYPNSKAGDVPDVHNCIDCEPRSLDKKRAVERQKLRRETASIDKKTKRPAAKSHKKKPKETPVNGTVLQVNGWTGDKLESSHSTDRRTHSPRDQPPPAKRPKTNHRNSSSTSSTLNNHSPSLPPTDSKRNGATHSADKQSPQPSPGAPGSLQCEMYSSDYLRLAKDDPGERNMETNRFSEIGVVNSLSDWIKDSDACRQATNGRSNIDVFKRFPLAIENLPKSGLLKRSKDGTADLHGNTPLCNYVVTATSAPAESAIEELKGSIGYLDAYRQESAGRYQALQHPEPFVFVHPHLPIFIDTRLEGTRPRYVRRSCRPNATLKTIVTNESESHFCFCALKDIDEGQEITISWNYTDLFRPVVSLDAQNGGTIFSKEQTDSLEIWVSNLLASYGGCACDSPHCSLSKWDRRARPDALYSLTNGTKPKRKRKAKQTSPLSTGKAVPSRSGSEGILDEDDERRSNPESTRSKPRSRDTTPMGSAVEGSRHEVSDRDKRKIAALEGRFEQLEGKDVPTPAQKKKKRPSGGATSNGAPGSNALRQAGNSSTSSTTTRPQYVSTGTSRRVSGSPSAGSYRDQMDFTTSPVKGPSRKTSSPSSYFPPPLSRPDYIDSATQTDPEELSASPTPPPRRKPFIPLTKRLLLKCHEEKIHMEACRKRKAEEEALAAKEAGHPSKRSAFTVNGNPTPVIDPPPQIDDPAPIPAAPSDQSPIDLKPVDGNAQKIPSNPEAAISPIKPPPAPWPSSTTIPNRPPLSTPVQKPNGHRITPLRVQLPSTPHFPTTSTPSTPASTATGASPSTGTPTVPASPLPTLNPPIFPPSVMANVVANPSPMKKKLSLSDYMSQRKSVAATTPSMAMTPAITDKEKEEGEGAIAGKPPVKIEAVLEGSVIVDTPPAIERGEHELKNNVDAETKTETAG
ncbi:MAG: hypothetical protein M1814_006824 [Vezdaea aestivalis]|nr:MAG: hypothetical protein M1814_006824 [Vezdaea aestivalis]